MLFRSLGGRQHDLTLGANWYLGSHLKLQANYIRSTSEREEQLIGWLRHLGWK